MQGSHLLAKSGLGNRIHLAPIKLCTMFICMSVLSRHLFVDNALSLLLYIKYARPCRMSNVGAEIVLLTFQLPIDPVPHL